MKFKELFVEAINEDSKWKIHLNNGKKVTKHAINRYEAKQSLSPNQLIIGIDKIEKLTEANGVTLKGDNLKEITDIYKIISKLSKKYDVKVTINKDENLVNIVLKGERVSPGRTDGMSGDVAKGNEAKFNGFIREFKKLSSPFVDDFDFSMDNAESSSIFIVNKDK